MQNKIYKDILIEFKNNFKDFRKFCKIDEIATQNIIKSVLKDEPLKNHKEEIRKGVSTFFLEAGFKAFLFFKQDESVVLNLKIVDFENNIFIDALKKNIDNLNRELKSSANIDDVKFLEKDTTDKISKMICVSIDKENRKEIIRNYIKKSLDLNPRDAIFFINGRIMIKYFKESESAKRMFDTISPEALKEIEKRVEKSGLDAKIKDMIGNLLTQELNPSKVDNLYFAKNLIRLLQEKFLKFLPEDILKEEPLVQQGYANYILRNNFDKCMLIIAKHLLEGLGNRDRFIESFVRFYNGDTTFSPTGKRYKKSDIIDSEGQRWNGSTLLQVVLQKKQGLEKLKKVLEDIKNTKEAVLRIEEQRSEIAKNIEKYKYEIEHLEGEFAKKIDDAQGSKDKIVELRTKLQKSKNQDEKSELNDKISTISREIKTKSREEERALANKKKNELEIERAEIKLKTLAKDIEAYEQKLIKNNEQKDNLIKNQKPLDKKYEEVATALAKAISSFRGV